MLRHAHQHCVAVIHPTYRVRYFVRVTEKIAVTMSTLAELRTVTMMRMTYMTKTRPILFSVSQKNSVMFVKLKSDFLSPK